MKNTNRLGPAMSIALEYIRENPGVNTAQVDRARRTARGGHACMYATVGRLIQGGFVTTGPSKSGRGSGLYAV